MTEKEEKKLGVHILFFVVYNNYGYIIKLFVK